MLDDLSIIILNYNDYSLTIECVDNLLRLGVKDRIIIIDNKSPNESFEILKERYKEKIYIKVVKSEENRGYAYGNNYALKKLVESKNVCIMNPDIIIKDPKIFRELLQLKEKYRAIGITCLQNLNGEFSLNTLGWKLPSFKQIILLNGYIIKKFTSGINYSKLKLISDEDNVAYIDVLPGCFFLIEYEKFKEVGFFDENTFLYYEENILAKKCKDKNYKFIVSLENFYIHNHKRKDSQIEGFKRKIKDRKIMMNSQKIYCEKYLKINGFKKFILKISRFRNLYISLPVVHVLKKILN